MSSTTTSQQPTSLTESLFLKRFTQAEVFSLLFLAVLIFLLFIAWGNRFIQDDAFISFNYADNLAEGKGLTWNEDERIEGYTNFLWTLLMSIAFIVKVDIVNFSYALSLFFFACNLVLTQKIAQLLFTSQAQSLLVTFLLGTNYSFSSYGTGGLETGLQTCTFLLSTFVILNIKSRGIWRRQDSLILSLIWSLALLNRLDSAIYLIAISPFLILLLRQQPQSVGQTVLRLGELLSPLILIIGCWLGWKLWYYGDILPNTFYVKASSITNPINGLIYFYFFLTSYWLMPIFILFCVFSRRLLQKEEGSFAFLTGIVVLWAIYLLKIGGGFMEYRLLIPILPFIFMLIGWLLFRVVKQQPIRTALILLIFAGSIHHGLTFDRITKHTGIERFGRLQDHLVQPSENWQSIGKVLGNLFKNNQSQVIIATTAAGAIPFYSQLTTIDMLGLNDKWIARNGTVWGTRPGHHRIATLGYLLDRQVNLVVGHPQMVHKDVQSEIPFPLKKLDRMWKLVPPQELPDTSRIIEIPIDHEYRLQVLYLKPSPFIDEVIRQHQFTSFPIAELS